MLISRSTLIDIGFYKKKWYVKSNVVNIAFRILISLNETCNTHKKVGVT